MTEALSPIEQRLRVHLSALDSAALPTKSEVFVISGRPARDLHDTLAEAASLIEQLQAENAGLREEGAARADLSRASSSPSQHSAGHDHLAQLSKIFGQQVTRFSVPGARNGVQVMEVTVGGESVSVSGANVDEAWSKLLAVAGQRSSATGDRLADERSVQAEQALSTRYRKALEEIADLDGLGIERLARKLARQALSGEPST